MRKYSYMLQYLIAYFLHVLHIHIQIVLLNHTYYILGYYGIFRYFKIIIIYHLTLLKIERNLFIHDECRRYAATQKLDKPEIDVSPQRKSKHNEQKRQKTSKERYLSPNTILSRV